MAKRVKSSSRPARRGRPARSPSDRLVRDLDAPVRPGAPPPPDLGDDLGDDLGEMPLRSSGHLTEDEIQRASELEADAAARERAAMAEELRRRRSRGHEPRAGVDVNAPLSVRAAHEYAYVARDVRRITLTAGLTVAIMAVIYVLVNVLGVVSI